MHGTIYRIAAAILLMLFISACGNKGNVVPASHYQTHRPSNYPVGIVSVNFLPQVDAMFETEGKGEGALKGAFNPEAFRVFPIGNFMGIFMGAYFAEDSKKIVRVKRNLKKRLGTANEARNALTKNVYHYFKKNRNDIPVEIVHHHIQSTSKDNKLFYNDLRLQKYATLLELQMLSVKFKSSGSKGAPICLEMSAKGRKISTKTHKVVDELIYKQPLGCNKLPYWFKNDGNPIVNSIKEGYKLLAENIVDEFYFIYQPKGMNDIKQDMSKRIVPYFVLSPQYPSIAFKSSNPQYKYHIHNGISFSDVNSLYPTFRWERFPRNVDYSADKQNRFSNISYDLRIYEYEGHRFKNHKKISLYKRGEVYEITGIRQPFYKLKTRLKPCQWYRWTVRTRFKLNGEWRATEWTGTYNTAGGLGGTDQTTLIKYFPSEARRISNPDSMFNPYLPIEDAYLPFRTPSADNRTCPVKVVKVW
jgi:hypothetical protein